MIIYTVKLDVVEGYDEFWETKQKPDEILKLLK